MMGRSDGIEEVEISHVEKGISNSRSAPKPESNLEFCSSPLVVSTIQKVVAELIGTYFVVFAGCGSVAVNKTYGMITFPGVAVTWGLIVMVMVYTVGHVSGAHFNPAVTLTQAIFGRCLWKEASLYIISQFIGSILASATLATLVDVKPNAYFGTVPAGSNAQSLGIEILITFLLVFVISGAVTDTRAKGDFGGIVVGMTIALNVFIAGPISGASMNPARSIGPALVKQVYTGLWVYILGPLIGALLGGFVYNFLRFTDQPLNQLAKDGSIVRHMFENKINDPTK